MRVLRAIGDWCLAHIVAIAATVLGLLGVAVMIPTMVALKTVTIYDDGVPYQVATFRGITTHTLDSIGWTVGPQDDVTVTDDAIYIERAFSVTVTADDGFKKEATFTDGTVADALAAVGVDTEIYTVSAVTTETALLSDDVTGMPLSPDMTIQLTSLPFEEKTVEETIPYKEQVTISKEIPAGARIVSQAGEKGKRTVVYRTYLKDGKPFKKVAYRTTVHKEPIMEYATIGEGALSVSPIPLELDENGVPKHYTRVLRGDACAYSGGVGTYTGAKLLQAGTVAVNPDIIPFGSKLFIVADNGYVYGYAEATDSGTAVMENLILVDLHMPTYNQCCRFGRHTVTVYFLE